jgi:hypothetical protein
VTGARKTHLKQRENQLAKQKRGCKINTTETTTEMTKTTYNGNNKYDNRKTTTKNKANLGASEYDDKGEEHRQRREYKDNVRIELRNRRRNQWNPANTAGHSVQAK